MKMKIKVFSTVDEHSGRPPAYEVDDVNGWLRVRIWHDGHCYDIAPDSMGRLTLQTIGGGQLVVRPVASNSVRLNEEL